MAENQKLLESGTIFHFDILSCMGADISTHEYRMKYSFFVDFRVLSQIMTQAK